MGRYQIHALFPQYKSLIYNVKNSGLYDLKWSKKPNNVLIVKKPNDIKTEKALVEVAK